MSTNAYAAKKALFDRLAAKAEAGQPLEGIQVAYAFPGNVDAECVYGGGVRFDHVDAVAEAPGVMVAETALVSVYVRILARQGDVVDTDARAAEVLATLGALLRAEPKLAGWQTWLGMASGQGDYQRTDDEAISILAVQVRIGSHLAYGG